MSDKKQTAVEYLVNKINNDFENNDFLINYANEIQQAKELEEQQIIDAYRVGFMSDDIKLAGDYYEETYGKL